MNAGRRSLALIAICIAVGFAADAAFVAFMEPALAPPLFIPAGAEIPREGYHVPFGVAGDTGRLVGSWLASQGGLIWIYPADSPPSGVYSLPCTAARLWEGTFNLSLLRGIYTMSISSLGGNFTVTATMTVLFPGNGTAGRGGMLASWCG